MHKELSPKKTVIEKTSMSRYEKCKIASVTVSVLVIAWTLSHPFRDSSLQVREDADSVSSPIDPVTQISRQGEGGDEYREEAIYQDMEFMADLQRKRDADRNLYRPGDQETEREWEHRTESMQAEIELLGDAPDGSIESQRRQSLEAMLADGPI